MEEKRFPTINEALEVRFESADHYCKIYEEFIALGGLCVTGETFPKPLEQMTFKLVLPEPAGEVINVPGQVVSVNGTLALIQFISFGDHERSQLSSAADAARRSSKGDSAGDSGAKEADWLCPTCKTHYEPGTKVCPKDGATIVPAASTTGEVTGEKLQPGTVLGQYKLLELVGTGGMGYVYKAEHVQLGRKMAIKLLNPEYAANPKTVKRFFGEAIAVNQIAHDNIVEITDFSPPDSPHIYYIMELLEGQTLLDALKESGPLSLERTLHIALQVTDTLAAVHNAGIVHRDLKPENIFLMVKSGFADFAKILDFGVAKLAADVERDAMVKTSAGAILGTPDYMAPEQVMGRPVDHRADIYAIGVILYELVTGQRPVVANSIGELVYKHMADKPKPVHKLENLSYEIPAAFSELTMSCLEKEPDSRPGSMDEITARLMEIRDELPLG